MFTASIIILGLLALFAAVASTRVLGRPGWTGAVLMALSGLGYMAAGIFNEDAHLLEHSIFALDQFVMSGLAVLVFAPVLANETRWGPTYATYHQRQKGHNHQNHSQYVQLTELVAPVFARTFPVSVMTVGKSCHSKGFIPMANGKS